MIKKLMISALMTIPALGYAYTYTATPDSIPSSTEINKGEQTDSLRVTELEAVVVRPESTYRYLNSAVYLPTKRQKNVSYDAISLLATLEMPELNVDRLANSATTYANEAIKYFINFVPAEQRDIDNMRVSDVLKVEYYDYSEDPRFMGAKHVVNFIMQEYEWGGYTKLKAYQKYPIQGNYGVTSKFAYKKMTYDIDATVDFDKQTLGGYKTNKTFLFPDQTIEKTEESKDYRRKSLSPKLSFRAKYVNGNTVVSNSLWYSNTGVPYNTLTNSVEFNPEIFQGSESTFDSRSHKNSLSYSCWVNTVLPHDFSMSVVTGFDYEHSNNTSTYTLIGNPEIYNASKSDYFINNTLLFVGKTFGRHNINMGVGIEPSVYKIYYEGTSNAEQKIDRCNGRLNVNYSLQLDKISIGTDLNGELVSSNVGTTKKTNINPTASVWLSYVPTYKHYINLNLTYMESSPMMSDLTNNVVITSELSATTGDSDLRNPKRLYCALQYWCNVNQALNFQAMGYYSKEADRMGVTYNPWQAPDTGRWYMLSSYTDDIKMDSFMGRFSATWKPFGGKLVLKGGVNYSYSNYSGVANVKLGCWVWNVEASHYLSNFFFAAGYNSAGKYYSESESAIIRPDHKGSYYLMAGYGNGDWNVSLIASNFFNRGDVENRTIIDTPYFKKEGVTYGYGAKPAFIVRASYTFGYGKKIARGDEISGRNFEY